jgi:hypothetical protein
MALGKNIKIDKVIPEENIPQKEVQSEVKSKDEVLIEAQLDQNLTNETVKMETKEFEKIEEKDERYCPIDVELDDIKIYYKPSKRKTQKRIMISLEGNFTLKNIHLLKENIPSIFENYDFLELKLENITDLDVSAIQLFHLMRFIYGPQKKFVAIKASFSDAQAKLLNTCGFYEFQTQIKAPN